MVVAMVPVPQRPPLTHIPFPHPRPHSTKFKILFAYGQIASLLSGSYNVALPASFLEYTKVLGFMQLDFVGMLPTACDVDCCRARRLCEAVPPQVGVRVGRPSLHHRDRVALNQRRQGDCLGVSLFWG